jgi:hypothetical protein
MNTFDTRNLFVSAVATVLFAFGCGAPPASNEVSSGTAAAPSVGTSTTTSASTSTSALAASDAPACTCENHDDYCDESKNAGGPNRCTRDCECGYDRVCGQNGWCATQYTCEQICEHEYDAMRQSCGVLDKGKTWCLTQAATLFAQCGNRCKAGG